ncbi:MAG: MOSC domain-containing protein [bacterium]
MNRKENRQGKVVAVSISERKGTRKRNVDWALLVPDWGIEGDAHAADWNRQVSFLAVESIDKIRKMGLEVGPGDFAENITTEDIDLPGLQIGDRLRIGDAELEVTQIGKECHSRCEIFRQAGDCVMPREGIFARVLSGGIVRKGDAVFIRSAESSHRPE